MPNPLDLSVLSDLENFSDLDNAPSQSKDDSPFRLLPWDKIEEDPDQPRTHMDEGALQELADSMKQKGQDGQPRGILQPISVRENPDKPGHYLINHGHRRHRAQGLAGLKALPVPAVLNNLSTQADQLLENIQREDLDAMDIGQSIDALVSKGWKVTDIARQLGKNKSWLARYRLLYQSDDALKTLYTSGLCRDVNALVELARAQDKHPADVSRFIQEALSGEATLSRSAVQGFLNSLKGASAPKPAPGTATPPESATNSDTALSDGDPQAPAPQSGDSDSNESVTQKPATSHSSPPDPARISNPTLWVSWTMEGERYTGKVMLARRPSSTGMLWVEEQDTGRAFELVAADVTLEGLTESK